jgi:hypothetical protein
MAIFECTANVGRNLSSMDFRAYGSGSDSGPTKEHFLVFFVRWASNPLTAIYPVAGVRRGFTDGWERGIAVVALRLILRATSYEDCPNPPFDLLAAVPLQFGVDDAHQAPRVPRGLRP